MKINTYRSAGVDIDAGNEAVARIKRFVPGIGGFGGLFPLNTATMRNPALVSGTDGVGTKLKIAFALDQHDTVGIDLVAMSVNDILTCGAQPLFFLDYIGCHKVIPAQISSLVAGMAKGCQLAGAQLLGGETAELSDLYAPGEYDLAGFAVGLVDQDKLIDGTRIVPGDLIIGLPSSGLHSNGYTLARKILGAADYPELLTPTKIYVGEVLAWLKQGIDIKGMAHITGGGLVENVPRALPVGIKAQIDYDAWQPPAIFQKIARVGQVAPDEMRRVFNLGIGFVVIISPSELEKMANPLVIGECLN